MKKMIMINLKLYTSRIFLEFRSRVKKQFLLIVQWKWKLVKYLSKMARFYKIFKNTIIFCKMIFERNNYIVIVHKYI